MSVESREFDHSKVFPSLLHPLALVSTFGDDLRVAAATAGFRSTLGIGQEHAGQQILPLLPIDWRASVEGAIRVCMGPRRSKRVRSLSDPGNGRPQFELQVYRPAGEDLQGHMLLALESLDHLELFADPRVASLFPQLDSDNAALVYENDLHSSRATYRDSGFARQFGIGPGWDSEKDFNALVHPDDLPEVARFRAARASLADDEIVACTIRLKARAGEWRVVTVRARVLRRDRTGAPRRMLGVLLDVTDHNALADALGEARIALVTAEEAERRRIGRELHDSMAQHLLAVSFGLHTLEREAPPTERANAAIEEIRTSITAATREIRMFSFLLHPPEISQRGLTETLRKLCADFGRRTGLAVDLVVDGEAARGPAVVEWAMYRVAQEALMNAFRHARAAAVTVRLRWLDETVSVEIADNGADPPDKAAPRHEGVGLLGMRERMQEVGGTLEINDAHPGMIIVARAPLALGPGADALPSVGRERTPGQPDDVSA